MRHHDIQYSPVSVAEASDADLFYEVMVRSRNLEWLRLLHRFLDTGHAVIAVGAMHLAGTDSLVSLLEKDGYMIKPILLPAEDQSSQ